jgi:hypothetical protein
VITTSDAEVERFRGGRPLAAILSGLAAALGFGLATSYLVVGERPWLAALWASFACTQLALAYIHGRRRVAMTAAHLVLGGGRRAVSIPWSQIQQVRLDWAAPPVGDRDEAFQVERRDGGAVAAAASLGQVAASVDQLVAALQRRAEIHGFEVEVRRPPSMRRTAHRR